MITNLFSVFDPSTTLLNLGWIMGFLIILLTGNTPWLSNNPNSNLQINATTPLQNEISFTISVNHNSQEITLLLMFSTIFLINFLALYPQVFSLTSHLAFTLPFSLTAWLTVMLFGWFKNTNHILAHLVPQGTPNALLVFIVFIELVSNLIRPLTLCVRLTANLIAGHLLITLLGNALLSSPLLVASLAFPVPLVLTILESAVAAIQAYVFITLVTLYTTEVN